MAFFVVYIAIIQGGQSAGQFFSFGPNIAQATASANRILSIRPSAGGEPQSLGAMSPPSMSDGLGADVQPQDVPFKYPSRNEPTFVNLDLTVESGQFAAFVGPSGCGKSTVISLLERFYDPSCGTVLFSGRDVRSLELSVYRHALSLVAQEARLFDGTVRDNLLLGLHTTDSSTQDQMVQACQDAEIHDFITSLPDGYATELGVNAQVSLSDGQKKRLYIARALLRKPLLLLLDEATSSLDSQSEKLVQAAMERGTHRELLRNRGAYLQMVSVLSSRYSVS